jgi:hypothetical protein
MDENTKKIKKMGAWTAAVFAAIFAIVLVFFWLVHYQVSHSAITALGEAFKSGWLLLLIDLVLCAGTYIGYSSYIKNKK